MTGGGSKHIPATLLHPSIKASRADVRTLFFTTENQAREASARVAFGGSGRDEFSSVWKTRDGVFEPVVPFRDPSDRPSTYAGSSRSSRVSSRVSSREALKRSARVHKEWNQSTYSNHFRSPEKKWYRREPPLQTNYESSSAWVEEPNESRFFTATHAMLAEGQQQQVMKKSGRYRTAGMLGLLYPIDDIPKENIWADRRRSDGLIIV
jgi:hypothetical protein